MKQDILCMSAQQSANCPFPEPEKTSQILPKWYSKIHLNIIIPFKLQYTKSPQTFRSHH